MIAGIWDIFDGLVAFETAPRASSHNLIAFTFFSILSLFYTKYNIILKTELCPSPFLWCLGFPTQGVHPMVASATSAVMILYTSFTATTSFMVFGLLQVCAWEQWLTTHVFHLSENAFVARFALLLHNAGCQERNYYLDKITRYYLRLRVVNVKTCWNIKCKSKLWKGEMLSLYVSVVLVRLYRVDWNHHRRITQLLCSL